jgi:hypothetical protein
LKRRIVAKKSAQGRVKASSTPRVSQRELRRQEHQRQQRQRNLIIGSVIGLAVIALAVLVYMRFSQPHVEGVVEFGTQGRTHDANVVLEPGPRPPVGGTHHPNWQNCGIYAEPVQDALAIHSLEHGAVWLTYRPDLSEEQVAALQDQVRGQSHILMSPYPTQDVPVVMTAWGLQMPVDSLPDNRIAEFVSRYRQGPQTPEPGASCTGGVGTPLG